MKIANLRRRSRRHRRVRRPIRRHLRTRSRLRDVLRHRDESRRAVGRPTPRPRRRRGSAGEGDAHLRSRDAACRGARTTRSSPSRQQLRDDEAVPRVAVEVQMQPQRREVARSARVVSARAPRLGWAPGPALAGGMPMVAVPKPPRSARQEGIALAHATAGVPSVRKKKRGEGVTPKTDHG